MVAVVKVELTAQDVFVLSEERNAEIAGFVVHESERADGGGEVVEKEVQAIRVGRCCGSHQRIFSWGKKAARAYSSWMYAVGILEIARMGNGE